MRHFIALSIGIVLLAVTITDFNTKIYKQPGRVIQWDVIDYYGYLPAVFIYHDITLQFKDHYQGNHHFVFWAKKTATGRYVFKMTMGLSFLYAPFFLAANLFAAHSGFDAGGYSQPYQLAIVLAALFYLALGLIFLVKVLRFYFSKWVTGLTILVIGLGTNLFWYSSLEPGMAHVYDFALAAIFIYLTIIWYQKINFTRSVLLGIVLGLLTLIRPVNVLFVIFFLFYGIHGVNSLKARLILYKEKLLNLVVIAVFGFLMLVPQLVYWKTVTGHWIYYSYGNQGFFFLHPHFVDMLFSFRKGWFVYTPVMIFAVVGIFSLFRRYKAFFWPILMFLVIYLYVASSWWCWWYGGSQGQRELIDIYPVMALPLAGFLREIKHWKAGLKYGIAILLFLSTLLGAFYNFQYYYDAIHWDSMTKSAYFNSFGRVHPSSRFKKLIQAPDYNRALRGLPAKKSDNSGKETMNQVIKRIKSDKNWYQLVKEKALKRNIPVDSMLKLDARYVLDHEN